jgi:hypothetical protein
MEKHPYRTILEMLEMMEEPYRTPCRRSYIENEKLFRTVRGSTHNHQTWLGGYHDHIEDAMNKALREVRDEIATGRPLPFTMTDALVAVYLHDFEKPWRFRLLPDGIWENTGTMQTKPERQAFREAKLAEYGIIVSPKIANAIRYAEGEGDDYRSDRRVMNELAALVHICDVYSARLRHDYPRAGDPLSGR